MKFFYYTILILSIISIVMVTYLFPEFLSGNEFLHKLIGPEFISLLGVIMAITFASVENIHLYLCKIEGELNKPGHFKNTRIEVNHNIHAMVVALILSVCSLFVLEHLSYSEVWVSLIYGFNLVVFLVYLLILLDIYALISNMAELLSEKNGNIG